MDEKQKWHFFNLYCMAVSDGNFASQELESLYKIAEEHGISSQTINEVIMTAGIQPSIPESMEEKIQYLYDLARIAWADGVINPEEKDLMRKFVTLFGFEPNNTEGIVDYFLEKMQQGNTSGDIINEINL